VLEGVEKRTGEVSSVKCCWEVKGSVSTSVATWCCWVHWISHHSIGIGISWRVHNVSKQLREGAQSLMKAKRG
jgi:hypothetical protein